MAGKPPTNGQPLPRPASAAKPSLPTSSMPAQSSSVPAAASGVQPAPAGYAQPGYRPVYSYPVYGPSSAAQARPPLLFRTSQGFTSYVPVQNRYRSNPYSHNISRTSPATVVWLHENFEACADMSLGREPLYSHYIEHCKTIGQEPVNQASFGKLIRSVFPNLKTRRLGTRGNSKYHYYGLRSKPGSKLYFETAAVGGATTKTRVRKPASTSSKKSSGTKKNKQQGKESGSEASSPSIESSRRFGSVEEQEETITSLCQEHFKQNVELPEFPSFSSHDLDFSKPYHAHCKEVVKRIALGDFAGVQESWNQFWGNIAAHFSSVLSTKMAVEIVLQCDDLFLKAIEETVLRGVLYPMPDPLLKELRYFAKCIVSWLKTAMEGMEQGLIDARSNRFKATAKMLRRYTSLNHLSEAASAVLDKPEQVAQMHADLCSLDFAAIQTQVMSVCNCARAQSSHIYSSMQVLLADEATIFDWAVFLQMNMRGYVQNASDRPAKAHEFMLRWTIFTSLVIRDLTLRSAPSFGSFNLLHLMLDELVVWLAERMASEGDVVFHPDFFKCELPDTKQHAAFEEPPQPNLVLHSPQTRVKQEGQMHMATPPSQFLRNSTYHGGVAELGSLAYENPGLLTEEAGPGPQMTLDINGMT